MKNLYSLFVITSIASILLFGCLEIEPPPTGIEDPEPTDEASVEVIHQAVSECGGFEESLVTEPAGDYCDAEVLQFTYDEGTETLEISDNRILLNCCGQHSMNVELVDGVYVITEIDLPEIHDGVEARCNCSCVFDFSITASGVEGGDAVPFRVERFVNVVDETPDFTWEGTLDLSAGEGEVVIDESEAFFCDPTDPVDPVDPIEEIETDVSECGGFPVDSWGEPVANCEHDYVEWFFDESAGTLDIIDRFVDLNCCGIRSVEVVNEDGVFVITEFDQPEGEEHGGRCWCTCSFDFGIRISDIRGDSVPVQIIRHTTDSLDGPQVVFEGEIELDSDYGVISIGEDTTNCI